jgi:hypothetical protein
MLSDFLSRRILIIFLASIKPKKSPPAAGRAPAEKVRFPNGLDDVLDGGVLMA